MVPTLLPTRSLLMRPTVTQLQSSRNALDSRRPAVERHAPAGTRRVRRRLARLFLPHLQPAW